MLGQARLDLRRCDVLAAALDHVLQASLDADVAALVHRREIAGVQPALGVDGAGGLLRQVVVAPRHARAAQAQLAGLGDPHLGVRQRPPDRRLAVRLRVAGGRHHRRAARLGHAERDAELRAEARLDAAHERRLDGRSAGHDDLDRLRVEVREAAGARASRAGASAPRRPSRGGARPSRRACAPR